MALIDGIKLDPVAADSKDYNWLKDKMHKTIYPGSIVKSYDIIDVFRIYNSSTWPNYTAARQRIFLENNHLRVEEKRLFHASPNAQVIGHQGFNLAFARSTGAFGAGIYFASNSSKSNDYAFGLGAGCPLHGNRCCPQCERTILVCKVALGKRFETQLAYKALPAGYNSLHYTGPVNEYVIYNQHQAYPSFLIKYRANY